MVFNNKSNRNATSCLQRQLMKRYQAKVNGTLRPLEVHTGCWIDLSVDFVTGSPISRYDHDMIMVVIDRFSKKEHFISLTKNFGSSDMERALYRFFFCYHEFPQTIVSDRDIRFASGYSR